MSHTENADIRTAVRYSKVAIILHWLIAALVIFQVALGWRMEAATGAAKFAAFQLHKSIGITLLLLVAIRLAWRFHHKPPPVAAQGWERVLANAVHGIFYFLLMALPISGWLIVSTSNIVVPTLLYGAIPWPHFPGVADLANSARAAWNSVCEILHANLVTALVVLFALHVAGALKHHFIDPDGGIARMAPGTRAGSWSDPRVLAIGVGVIAAAGLGWAGVTIGTAKPVQPKAALPGREAPIQPAAAQGDPRTEVAANAEIANVSEAIEDDMPLSSWTIGKNSSLRFQTSWSGQAIAGGFNRFDGTIHFSPDLLDKSRAEIRIETGSVFSGDSQRDEALTSPEWFASGSHGAAVFRASRFRKTGANAYIANGTLTLKGSTLPIALPFTLSVRGDKAIMQGTATIDRTAYKIGEGEYASTSEIPATVRVNIHINATRRP